MSTVGPPTSDSPEAGTSIYQAALQKEEINFCYESGVNFEPLPATELRHGNDCHRDSEAEEVKLWRLSLDYFQNCILLQSVVY